jgi:hypothetical protein
LAAAAVVQYIYIYMRREMEGKEKGEMRDREREGGDFGIGRKLFFMLWRALPLLK